MFRLVVYAGLAENLEALADMLVKAMNESVVKRPVWISSYEITRRHEPFKNSNAKISRKSIAHLVARCIYEDFGLKDSLG